MLNCSGGWKVMRQISANDVWRSTASPGTIQPPMAVLDFAHLTWEEVRDLDRTKAVAILPVGAVEAHGPHLPLATDVIIAETMARAAAARLAARGHDVVLLPPLAYTAAAFAAGFPGTVSLRPATVPPLLADLPRSPAPPGLRVLAVANAHLDPPHLAATAAAAAVPGAPGRAGGGASGRRGRAGSPAPARPSGWRPVRWRPSRRSRRGSAPPAGRRGRWRATSQARRASRHSPAPRRAASSTWTFS